MYDQNQGPYTPAKPHLFFLQSIQWGTRWFMSNESCALSVKQSLYPCKLSFIILFISIYRLDTLSIIFFEFLTDQMSYFFCTSKIKHRGAIVCKRVRIFTSFYDEFAGVIFPILSSKVHRFVSMNCRLLLVNLSVSIIYISKWPTIAAQWSGDM